MAVSDRLSPWPVDGTTRSAELAARRLALATGQSEALATVIGPVAAALVERYAPGAPQAVKDEATIRCAGYLATADFGAVQSEAIGPRSLTWTPNHADMFRRSGAAALLTRWRVRRAKAIG